MHVFLIAAITADGFIGRDDSQVSTEWTSKEDKKFFNTRTKQAKVMIMGGKTYATINRPLPGRLSVVYSRQNPETPVVEIPPADQLPETGVVVFTKQDPKQVLDLLTEKKYSEVAICGGSSIYSLFMNLQLVNTLYLTLEPIIFGSGVKLLSESTDQKLVLKQETHLNEQTLLLEYSVQNS